MTMKIVRVITVQPNDREKDTRNRSRVYVWKENEHIVDTLIRRDTTNSVEVAEFRRLVPKAIIKAKLKGLGSFRWTKRGELPGFLTDKWLTENKKVVDVHVVVQDEELAA